MILRAAVSIKADATYVVPVADVAYIDLVVAAGLDTSGRYRYIQEAAAVVDGVAFVLSRPRADNVATADTTTTITSKNLADTVSFSDVVQTLLVYIRAFSNTANFSDTRTSSFLPFRAEQLVVADDNTAVVDKPFSESSVVADASAYVFSTAFSESTSPTDANSLIFTTSRVESVTAADVGLLSVQDYSALSYFAEDYVGFSQAI